ncbi:uncharacterized protein PAN0_039c6329 [Moesziomyces antarcticus]|uniref:Uncharacterized protein n=2 Tax=Pseudozyma antarctica TaxID=84753 RepID=A0A081CN50_PSEA2|nr:uncharacterized protein PAN0_039c6329 [Moesziomyces antarcticus]GAK68096.1 conserved hypothetical protein [Moesziomyces antarcticus]SPO47394.1 probable FLR1 - Putative H+ antiporter involved in multidrug resistance [Moesziomyces antarcticus]
MQIGDTAFGQLARALSRGRFFPHPETVSGHPLDHDAPLEQGGSNTPDKESPSATGSNEHVVSLEHGGSSTPDWLHWAGVWGSRSDITPSTSASDVHGSRKSTSDDNPDSDNRVGWYGEADPANPQNWRSSQKAFVAGIICIYTFGVYLGSAIYTPSMYGVMQQFNVSYAAANLGLALFVFGYGAGAMIFSPLSEIPSLGRNWIYIITFTIYLALTIGTAAAPNFGSLITLRFLAGFFGSPALATGGATLQDMYSIVKLPYGIALWVAAAGMGPAFGPITGFAMEAKTWRWPLWIQVWLCAPVLILMFFAMPETSAQNILYRRAKRLRAATQWKELRSHAEVEQQTLSLRKIVVESLVRPIQISILDPGTGFMNIYVSLVYAIYYSFFESFPLVYPPLYGFGLGAIGLTFLSVVVTTGLGAGAYTIYVYYYVEAKIRRTGELPSLESRLIPAIPASVLMPIGLFLFAWTSRESIHWMVGLIGVAIYGLAFYVLVQCVLLYVNIMYPKYSASLLAANDFCRSSLATAFIMAGRPLFTHLGIGGGVSLIAGLACVCVPLLLLLYRFGPYLRSKSKFAGMSDSSIPVASKA